MTLRTEARLTIEAPTARVWTYVCDVRRWPEWAPTVLECWVRGGQALQPGAEVDQRAKLILGMSRRRSQRVVAVEAPRHVEFAGPMGTSAARWALDLEPVDDRHTDALMWVEIDLRGVMRAVPGPLLQRRVQGVSELEMRLIKAAVEGPARTTP